MHISVIMKFTIPENGMPCYLMIFVKMSLNLVVLQKKAKEFGKQKSFENVNPEDYIATSGEQPRKKKSKRD